jgi:hypothetical protein
MFVLVPGGGRTPKTRRSADFESLSPENPTRKFQHTLAWALENRSLTIGVFGLFILLSLGVSWLAYRTEHAKSL